MELGRWRATAGAITLGYCLIAAALPLFVLLYGSLRPTYSSPSLSGLTDLTLVNYSDALSGESSLRGFRNSLVLGVSTATAVMLVMAVAAWLVVRTRVRGRWVLDAVASLPLVVPGLVLGVALLFIYLRSPIPVYGTLLILFFAYFTRFMPHGIRFASVSMQQLGGELEEAARTSGASWGQSFRRVVLPLAAPGLAAGWIYVFILSMRELSTSVLLYSPGTEVVPVQIWRSFSDGRLEAAAANGMLLMLLLVLLAGIGALFVRRARLV
jgi:iron(III) transport system permease protein